MKIKISFITDIDYANCLTEWSNCINQHSSVFESKIISFHKHVFDYTLGHDWDLINCTPEQIEEAKKWIMESKHVIIAEEVGAFGTINIKDIASSCRKNNFDFINVEQGMLYKIRANLGIDLIAQKDTKLYCFHSGSLYRTYYSFFNSAANPYYKIFYGPDLYRLGNKRNNDKVAFCTYRSNFSNEEILNLIDQKFEDEKLIISHTPSNIHNKGTEYIKRILEKVMVENNLHDKYDFIFATNRPHNEIIEIKKKSHICIGEFSPMSLDIGGFGVSSIESVSLGNICLSSIYNIIDDAVVKSCEGVGPPQLGIVDIGSTEEHLEQTLKTVLMLNKKDLKKVAKQSFLWYQNYLSPEAVCKKLEYELSY